MRLTRWIDELRDDIRFAVRQLWRAPAFTVVATLTLALGIGANSAIFALVDATLLRPLPFATADRLVMAWEQSRTAPAAACRRPTWSTGTSAAAPSKASPASVPSAAW